MTENKLWPRNQIISDESLIPLLPRFFWRSARRHFEDDDPVSAIVMCGLSVESGVNEYAAQWMHRTFAIEPSEAVKVIECMDFRRSVKLLMRNGELSKRLKKELDSAYNSRNKYVHVLSAQILSDLGEQYVQTKNDKGQLVNAFKFKDNDFFRTLGVYMKADQDAPKIIEKTERCISGLFEIDNSDYWQRLVWGEKKDVRTAEVPSRNAGNPELGALEAQQGQNTPHVPPRNTKDEKSGVP